MPRPRSRKLAACNVLASVHQCRAAPLIDVLLLVFFNNCYVSSIAKFIRKPDSFVISLMSMTLLAQRNEISIAIVGWVAVPMVNIKFICFKSFPTNITSHAMKPFHIVSGIVSELSL